MAQKPSQRQLQVDQKPGESRESTLARVALNPLIPHLDIIRGFSSTSFGDASLTALVEALREPLEEVKKNDLTGLESMLATQAISLNIMFGELARRAHLNMGEHLTAMETYMRLALKMQAQCRATIETLATIKNPPVVFARQANISNGPQQVNNGTLPARAGKTKKQPNELLQGHGDAWLDSGAAATSSASDSPVEAVAAGNRP